MALEVPDPEIADKYAAFRIVTRRHGPQRRQLAVAIGRIGDMALVERQAGNARRRVGEYHDPVAGDQRPGLGTGHPRRIINRLGDGWRCGGNHEETDEPEFHEVFPEAKFRRLVEMSSAEAIPARSECRCIRSLQQTISRG